MVEREQEQQPRRELYCVPCDAVFPTRAAHLRFAKPDSWSAINVPETDNLSYEVIQQASIEKPQDKELPKAKRRRK